MRLGRERGGSYRAALVAKKMRAHDPVEPKPGQIELVDKDVDHPNGIVLTDPVFQTFRKQRALTAIQPLNEAPHLSPRKSRGNHIARIKSSRAFLHNQGQKRRFDLSRNVS